MAVDTIGIFTAQNAERTAAAMPDIDYSGSPALVFLAYSDSIDQTEYWLGWCPEDYGGGGLTVSVGWTIESTSGDNFGAEVGFARLEDGVTDIDIDNFASNKTGTWAHNAQSGRWNLDSIIFSDGSEIDNIAAGEFFLIRLKRNASVGSDLVGDVLVAGMIARET